MNIRMRRLERVFHANVIIAVTCVWMLVICGQARALESGSYRVLSVSESEKLVLVSRIPDQKKYLLDAADVKVTINDRPAELKDIISFAVVQVQMDLRKTKKKGVNIDGIAREIAISDPTEPQVENSGGD